MKQSCRYTLRRNAAIGAAVAIVTASSAFGIGAGAASADTGSETPQAASASASAPATTTASDAGAADDTEGTGGAAPDQGSAPADESVDTTAPAADPAPAPDGDAAAPAPAEPAAAPGTATDTAAAQPEAAQPEGAQPDVAAPEAATPVTWADPSSADAPIALTATAGQPFSHTFTAQGGDGPLEYLFNPVGFDPSNDANGWTWNEHTGVLSATPRSTIDGPVRFEVTATDQHQTAVQYVEVTLEPGAPVGVTFGVTGPGSGASWQVDADGTVRQYTAGGGQSVVSAIPATVGSSLTLAGLAVDALGNRTTPGEDYPRSTVTSTVASDTVAWDDQWAANTVSFSTAGTRTLTVTEGGVSTSVTISVAEAPAPVAAIVIGVLPDAGSANTGLSWGVDGDVITQFSDTADAKRIDAIPVAQGERVQIRALAVDADGQPVGEHTDLSITSDVASDRIAYDPAEAATWVTFEHASPHTITVSEGGVTSTIRFEVQPAAATVVSTTHTPTASGTASGTLAYTGADESGPLAWALGLLASGAGLLVWRLRRRLR